MFSKDGIRELHALMHERVDLCYDTSDSSGSFMARADLWIRPSHCLEATRTHSQL